LSRRQGRREGGRKGGREGGREGGWERTFLRASGCLVNSNSVQVRTAADVSWPAMSMVIRSSLSWREVEFSPLMSTRKLKEGRREGGREGGREG